MRMSSWLIGAFFLLIGCDGSVIETQSSTGNTTSSGSGGSGGNTMTSSNSVGGGSGSSGTGGTGGNVPDCEAIVPDLTVEVSTMLVQQDVPVGKDEVRCLNLVLTYGGMEKSEFCNWKLTLEMLTPPSTEGGLIDSTIQEANYTNIKLARISADQVFTILLGPTELSLMGDDATQQVVIKGIEPLFSPESYQATVALDLNDSPAMVGDQFRCTLEFPGGKLTGPVITLITPP